MLTLKKKIRLIVFVLIFIVIAPIVVLYAKGDIFTDGWNILSTGGIYVTNSPSGSDVFLNSKMYGTTSFFKRDILIKNLRKGTYKIAVKKDGYNTWTEDIKVDDNLVSDANIFILPAKMELREISKYVLTVDSVGSTTVNKKQKNQEYTDIVSIFSSTTAVSITKKVSTSTDFISNLGTKHSPIMSGKIGLWQENNIVYSKWFGSDDSAPKYFCDEVDCAKTITVYSEANKIKRINFLPQYDDVAIIASGNKILAVQIEKCINKNPQTIYQGTSPDFKIINGGLYIKDKDFLAEVVL